ncbi:initiation factor 2 [Cutaneotrichosporon oleaginosum]|uniref:Translation initiation factor IF-2, mitochondrial n=1 Tax=Cutaneotrichosporon oleaginosum TaxID=879819 RepID=A0A0J0XY62_9TREE|nr:initiation factor 2 [Cutaneotrichosporon oleaginosum]KLT45981.1 initiation factor 2 [Cutaneotrichosporon oleaginosum]TXT06675.1 hypothetical protein COLE_06006 [Cutaneotrichosporon oleaginosum]
MSVSVCRCSMLAPRLRGAALQIRALHASATIRVDKPLAATNWGNPSPAPKQAVGATNWGAPPARKPQQQRPRNRDGPPRQQRDGGGFGMSAPRGERQDGGGGAGQWNRGRRDDGGGQRDRPPRHDGGIQRDRPPPRDNGGERWGPRGGDGGRERGPRRDDGGMARGGNRGRERPQRDGGRDRDGAKPLAATNWGSTDVVEDTPARGRNLDAAAESGPSRYAEAEDEEGRGRRRQAASSRSLLNAHLDEAELPSAQHRSVKEKKKKGERFNKREWVMDEENDADLAEMDSLKRKQQEKAERARAKAAAEARKAREALEKDVYIPGNISVAQLADKFGIKVLHLQRKMIELGMSEEVRSSAFLLNADDATSLALEYNLNPIIDSDRGYDIYPEVEEDLSKCPLRPPVVTIMGHVDHGKTTLLDALRHTSVAAGEAGGITQHIGAFSVPLSSLQKDADSEASITFLDTPGHAAFTGMRARGASVTDLVVLVVAADDGVMPQTKEVISLVQKEGDNVGLVVAINKCDKPQIDVAKVKAGLGSEGIILEEDGGDVPSVRVSGLARIGLDDLVETLATLAEVRDLRARKEGKTEGWVLESHVDKGLGTVATVLVTRGTLREGTPIVAGHTWARVRTMTDSAGNPVTEAGPGTPVSVTGWRDVPLAGDQLLEAPSEAKAKACIDNRIRDQERKQLAQDAEAINIRRQEDRIRLEAERVEVKAAKEAGLSVQQVLHNARRVAAESADSGRKELRLIIKADVSGTVEAVVGSLSAIGNKEAGVKIVHTGVGEVTESDVMLGDAADGTVIGFNVECPRAIQSAANDAGVPVITDSVIYRLIENVRGRVAALLPPRTETRVIGEATVSMIFPLKSGRKVVKNIAGCKVMNGTVAKADRVRVLRDREVVFEGMMDTLKHMKKDVLEMRKGTECGIALEGFDDIREGDQIVTFQTFEVARELN